MPQDDSDIKIMPDRASKVFDSAEGAATAFLRETHNGNMKKAKELGSQLAVELCGGQKGATLFGVGLLDNEQTIFQRKVLFAYLAVKVTEDLAPNSLVAQSAIAAFYDTAEKNVPEIYGHLVDPAVFSQYALASRSNTDHDLAIGRIFARLCGREDDQLFVRYGRELTGYFTMYCSQLFLKTQMVR